MVRGPPLGASLGSDLRAQHDMETFKMELARSLGCKFSEKLFFPNSEPLGSDVGF